MIDFELGLTPDERFFELGHLDNQANRTVTIPPPEPALQVASQLDTAEARVRFAVYDKAVTAMLDRANTHAITDDATNHEAVAMASQSKAISNKIEKLRKQIVDEPNQFVKAVNTFAKNYTNKLTNIETGLKTKINVYQREQERKRLEAQRIANEEAARLQEEINKAAKEADEAAPVVVLPVIVESQKVTRTESGSASLRKVWTWKLTNFADVPDEYKTTQDTKINQAVKAGVREIPGIDIYEQSTTVIRSSWIDENWKF